MEYALEFLLDMCWEQLALAELAIIAVMDHALETRMI